MGGYAYDQVAHEDQSCIVYRIMYIMENCVIYFISIYYVRYL